ncbi:MAG: CHRD domain-containing protein [Allosphingosinicella sp.]
MRMRSFWMVPGAVLLLAGCATGGEPGNQRANLAVTLTGTQEVPSAGDPDGTGTVEVEVEPALSRLCWDLYARQIEPATAAHLHRGAAGVAGPPVVTLTTPDATGRSEGCAQIDPALARELVMRAHDYYVNVHNGPYPNGAIRGQLRGGAIAREPMRPPGT